MTTAGVSLAVLVLVAVWGWAVTDIARHDRLTRNYKIFWIIFTLVFPLVGVFVWLGFRPPRQGDLSTGYFSDDAMEGM
ncbi:MAG: PLDc_N domain-containing protein [Actinomycetia bacterium]|nr:PLDc_N domain-containing protein [Actinomycetes bacterium]